MAAPSFDNVCTCAAITDTRMMRIFVLLRDFPGYTSRVLIFMTIDRLVP